jgi:hypothetical protein
MDGREDVVNLKTAKGAWDHDAAGDHGAGDPRDSIAPGV